MKKYIGRTPKELLMYKKIGDDLVIPYGMKEPLISFLNDNNIKYELDIEHPEIKVEMKQKAPLNLYDYQEEAVKKVLEKDNGVLVSPAGSGKTRMAMEIINARNTKTLWLTNNLSLLNQTKKVFETFFSNKTGEIKGGKVNIQDVTFATVQTLSKLDLYKYRDTFGMVIVDEAHRVVGSPTKAMMFYKVISNINARYKYGLTATLFDKPNDMSSVPLFILGEKLHEIKKEEVKRVTAEHIKVELNTPISIEYLNPDRTVNYNDLIRYLIENDERNFAITYNLLKNADRHNIILSSRNDHLRALELYLNGMGIETRLVLGETKMSDREQYFKDFEEGKVHFLLSNYQLAKEGLDLPIADTLHLVTPMRDKRTIIQSAGRVERVYKGKTNSKVYDYVDVNIGMLENMYKDRRRHLNAR